MKLRNTPNMMPVIAIFLLMIACSSFGCARMIVNMAGGPAVSIVLKKLQNIDSARLLQDGLAGDLLLVTVITEMSPNNPRLLKECFFGYFAYGLIMEDEDPEYAKELFTIGREYGLRTLKQNRKFAKGLKQGKKIYELVDDLPKKYAEALCWTAWNDGFLSILNVDDDPGAMIAMADVVKIAKKSMTMDETYFFGATTGLIACYYSLVPQVLDPDAGPENARAMFKKAREISGGKFLLIDYMEARFLATCLDYEDLFKKRLKSVLAADSSALKGVKAFNEVAKVKAKYYLDHQDEYF
jgi:hypothetical protein